jgi:hypothetical protein
MSNSKLFFIIFLLIAVCSCSPQRKLNRLRIKYPDMFKTDTLRFRDTLISKEVRKDTVFFQSRDTTIIVKDRLTIKHFMHDSTIYISGHCASDTVIKYREVVNEKIVYKEKKSFFDNVFNLMLILIVILVIYHTGKYINGK